MIFYEDSRVTLYCGDALKTLQTLPDASVQMVMTSPPYWGLRDYHVEVAGWRFLRLSASGQHLLVKNDEVATALHH